MAQNAFRTKSDAALSAMAHQANSVISTNLLGYGVSAPQIGAVETAADTLDADVADVTAKTAALKAAHEGKRADRTALINALTTVGNIIYNNPAVTPEMIAAAGYAVHDSSGTPVVPNKPVNLLATPFSDGTVSLRWGRNGNPNGVSFLIEAREDGSSEWEFVATTTKARITVNGFAPGVAKWFRVVATKNDLSSLPSNEAPIYPVAGTTTLSVAA